MKKLLAILLAVLTVFSFCSVAAAAEDEPVSEPASEPAETFTTYEICEDPDFLVLKYMAEGNDKATLLVPGDKITTYKNSNIDVLYYADADAMYKGDWEPSDPNNLAFSLSAAEQFKETFTKAEGAATVRGLGDETADGKIDFTIAYSDENTFLGWVVYDYDPAKNTIKLCAVWEKNHKDVEVEKEDDMNTILDFFFNIRRAMHDNITLPFLQLVRTINNAFLAVETYLYNMIFGKETAA
jgi:hypothetical protein